MRKFIYRNSAPIFVGVNSPKWNTMYRELGLCARDLYLVAMTNATVGEVVCSSNYSDLGSRVFKGVGYLEMPKSMADIDEYQVHFLYDEIVWGKHVDLVADIRLSEMSVSHELHRKKIEYERVDFGFDGFFRVKDVPRLIAAMGFDLKRNECWYKTEPIGINEHNLTIRLRYPKERDTFYPACII